MLNLEEVRKIYVNTGKIQTHSENCWKWHPHCCIAILCDEIERLKTIEVYKILSEHGIKSKEDFQMVYNILDEYK